MLWCRVLMAVHSPKAYSTPRCDADLALRPDSLILRESGLDVLANVYFLVGEGLSEV